MPVVPTEAFEQRVFPGGQMGTNDTKASPESFGGQVGQTLEQTGNMLEQHTVQRQQTINAANVDDVNAKQFDPAQRQIYMDFLQLKGKDAETQFPAFQQKMKALATETAASLPNAMQQHAFNEIARWRMAKDLDGMARHAAQQTNDWIANTSEATAGVYSNRIVDNRNDPATVAGFVNNINTLYKTQGQMFGENPVFSQAKAANVIDSGINRAINTELEGNNPENAQNLFNQYKGRLSNDGLRADIQNRITPALDAQHLSSVKFDLETRFNPTDPNVNPQDALNYIRNPANYVNQITPGQRTDIENAFLGDRKLAIQAQKTNQSMANNNFIDAINKNQIGDAVQFINWKDKATGLPAAPKLVQSAIDRSIKGAEGQKENRQTLIDLTDQISNRGLTDSEPINTAYLDGNISGTTRKELLGLQDKMRHPEKDPWFKEAESMYKDRYGENDADAKAMYPQFINNLDQAVKEQNLKGHQIYEMAQKMLTPVDNALMKRSWTLGLAHGGYNLENEVPAPEWAQQWGGFPKPRLTPEHFPEGERTFNLPEETE